MFYISAAKLARYKILASRPLAISGEVHLVALSSWFSMLTGPSLAVSVAVTGVAQSTIVVPTIAVLNK